MSPITPIETMMAKLVLRAMELRETSYDHAAADLATAQDRAQQARFAETNPGEIYHVYGGVDYLKFYRIDLQTACDMAAKEAGHEALGRLVYLALDGWWNDTHDWARQVLDPAATVSPTHEHCQHGAPYTVADLPNDSIPAKDQRCGLCNAFYISLRREADDQN